MTTGSSIASGVLLVAGLVAASFLLPVLSTSAADVGNAFSTQVEEQRAVTNTAFTATASYDADTDTLTVKVENTGERPLELRRFSVLTDGEYTSTTKTVGGSSARTVIDSGETATFTTSTATRPQRVRVVGPFAIARTIQ